MQHAKLLNKTKLMVVSKFLLRQNQTDLTIADKVIEEVLDRDIQKQNEKKQEIQQER